MKALHGYGHDGSFGNRPFYGKTLVNGEQPAHSGRLLPFFSMTLLMNIRPIKFFRIS
jgi:hypothetical protein